MKDFFKEYHLYTQKPKYSPFFIKLFWILVIEICIIAGCVTAEILGRILNPVAVYHGPDFWIFYIAMQFILFFYFLTEGESGKFFLSLDMIHHNMVVIPARKQKKLKGIAIFQIDHIPKTIVVKEDRIRKKTIEKLVIPGTFQYIHDHLTLLAGVIPNISFEIRIKSNDIKLRIYISQISKDLDSLAEKIESLKNFTSIIFQTVFPGIKFQILRGKALLDAWAGILGGYVDYSCKIKNNVVVINRGDQNKYLAVLKMVKPPKFLNVESNYQDTQIGEFIRHILGLKLDCNYVVSAESSKIHTFSRIPQLEDDLNLNPFNEKNVQKSLQYIRHSEVTGGWNTSCYVVIRSNNRYNLENDISRTQSIVSNHFNIELSLVDSKALKREVSRILERAPLHEWIPLTSESFAVLFHLPQKNLTNFSGSEVPTFDVPPELEVQSGIPVGNILLNDQSLYPLHLSLEDLQMPLLITGGKGMGKSTLTLYILNRIVKEYPEVNWCIFDSHNKFLQLKDISPDDVKVIDVLSPSSSTSINLFDPLQANTNEHARKLLKILEETFPEPFTEQIHQICLDALKRVVKNVRARNLENFLMELNCCMAQIKGENRISVAIETLIKQLSDLRGSIIDREKIHFNFDDLLLQKTILNFNSPTDNVTKNEKRLLLNIILKHFIDHILCKEFSSSLRFILVIEDAHLIGSSLLREVPETSFISDIPRLLAKHGVGLISITAYPERSLSLVENSEAKFVFRVPYSSKIISVNDIQEQYIQNLPKREAVVSLPRYPLPFRIYTKYKNQVKGLS